MLGWILIVACSGKGDDSSTPADDSGGPTDSGDDILYPEGDRILLYHGNGGFDPDIAGTGVFEKIAQVWKDEYGWNTDDQTYWPDSLDDYRLIGLIAPGWDVVVPFEDKDVANLQAALDRGTRIVVFGEPPMCEKGADAVNALVGALGATWTMRGEGASQFSVVETNAVAGGFQMTEGVSQLQMYDPCWLDKGNGNGLVADNDNNFIVVEERPGKAGDLVFVGDITIMDDTEHAGDPAYEEADNLAFLDNMVRITPK